MNTRRIEGTDIQAALREVRRVMGPDAVIMSTRETQQGIEIVASAGAAAPRPARRRQRPAPARAPGAVASGGFAALVSGLARPLEAPPARPDPAAALDALGLAADVREALREALAGAAPDDVLAAAHGALAARIPVEGPALMRDGGRVAVLGATGVGKTTTIAKLAAHFARRYGPGTVALVNADHYRIGASDQLRRYARLIGVPVHDVHGAKELERRLDALRARRLVLVDTAGMAPGDVRFDEQVALLEGAGLDSYLALSLNTQIAVLARTVRAFRRLAPRALILTKEDEAVSLGGALSMAVRHALPVAFVTTGPGVPADIRLADAAKLVARAGALAASAGEEEAPEEARGQQPAAAPREVAR